MKGCLTGGLATLSRFFAILRLSANGRMDQGRPRETQAAAPAFSFHQDSREKAATWLELDVQSSVPM
jgi:hypothetical protein